jgi:Leucine-rich repeat (LRR) protein
MLYLQRNRIETISGLGHLTKLRKLYLSRNKIDVVENLNKLTKLEGENNLVESLAKV